MIPFIAIMMGQALLYYCVTFWGGTIQQMETNSYEIFNQKVANRQSYLQSDMIHRWSNLDETIGIVNDRWEALSKEYSSSSALLADRDALGLFLEEISNSIIYTLRKNSVTGAFIILDQPMVEKGSVISRPGLYVRDTDPESSASDNSDLAIKHGSAALYRQLGITTDILWTPRFRFDSAKPDESRYFDLPMEAAAKSPGTPPADLGYWGEPTPELTGSGASITYSAPLIDSTGKVYGIVGVDISLDYLKKMLPVGDLNENNRAAYCLAKTTQDSNNFALVATSGSYFKRYFTSGSVITPVFDEKEQKYFMTCDKDSATVYMDVQPLQLYNSTAPFAEEQWALLGVISTGDLLSFQNKVTHMALSSSMIAILAGIVLGSITITLLTKPIRRLIIMLRSSDPQKPVKLSKVHVTEIDELSAAIEDLSLRVSESSSNLSRIIEMSGMSVAAFEVNRVTNQVVFSGHFFTILCMDDNGFNQDDILDSVMFRQVMENGNFVVDEELDKGWILHICPKNRPPRWVKMTLMDEPNQLLGVLVDITEDTLSKRHIEYERDYDLLTNLLNRRAFTVAMHRLFDNPDILKVSALVMLDLDNLKYINDSYGHDCGDGYLSAAANAMNSLPLQNMLVARMSGDEFFVFIYGHDSRQEVQQYLNQLKQNISESYFILPGGDSIRIRCSAGVTWYPDDTTRMEEITRYADFAMYTAKNSKKGDFCEFVRADYDKNSYLIHSREELNKLIEHSLLDYYFQPIVSAATGEVFAYEALMRSRLSTLSTPLEILALARTQSKLYEIEKLTWMTAMASAVKDPVFTETKCRIFINSVSNHILSDDDIEELRSTFQKHLHRMVLEITEEEKFNEDLSRKKQQLLYRWGGQVALDDFGTGYNGEMVLLKLVPDYVKIDMSIVRNIDTDPSRQELFRNLVNYSHDRNIMVVAEGVESSGEMNALVHLGADYLQGYYLGKPAASMQLMTEKIITEIKSIAAANNQESH